MFHEAAASPEVKGRFLGKSDWQVVQGLVAPNAARLYLRQAVRQIVRGDPAPWVQPFDMPMAHVEMPSAQCSPINTEVVVFSPREGESATAMWQRFTSQKEDDLDHCDRVHHTHRSRSG